MRGLSIVVLHVVVDPDAEWPRQCIAKWAFIHLDGSLEPAMRQKGGGQALPPDDAQIGLLTKVR